MGTPADPRLGTPADPRLGNSFEGTLGSVYQGTLGSKGVLLRGFDQAKWAYLRTDHAVDASHPEAITHMAHAVTLASVDMHVPGVERLELPVGAAQNGVTMLVLDSCFGSPETVTSWRDAIVSRRKAEGPVAEGEQRPGPGAIVGILSTTPLYYNLFRYGQLGASDYLALPFVLANSHIEDLKRQLEAGTLKACPQPITEQNAIDCIATDLLLHFSNEGLARRDAGQGSDRLIEVHVAPLPAVSPAQ